MCGKGGGGTIIPKGSKEETIRTSQMVCMGKRIMGDNGIATNPFGVRTSKVDWALIS